MKVQALHHIFYCFSILCNVLVVTIYWTVLHHKALVQFQDFPKRQAYMYTVHSVPAVVCMINTWVTRAVMKKAIVKGIIVFAMVYISANYYHVARGGKPIYWFLAFDDIVFTAGVVTGLVGGSALLYLALCEVDAMVKGKVRIVYVR